MVGNIDSDPALEILATSEANGPLYAWNSDGSRVPGWPVYGAPGISYPGLGNLSNAYAGLEVFSGYLDWLVAYAGTGEILSGWPRDVEFYAATAPGLADVNGDGLDEIFIGESYCSLHAYQADGSPLPGWPVHDCHGGSDRSTPAIVDLDGDGDLEILSSSDNAIGPIYLFAYHHDGTPVDGFPLYYLNGYNYILPAIGDVDGDSALEIITVYAMGDPLVGYVDVLLASGVLERRIRVTGGNLLVAAPALADLDRDCVPEIVVQRSNGLNAWRGDGTIFPGWPITWPGDIYSGNSAPIVGDVNGDTWPEIVATDSVVSSNTGHVRVTDRFGVSLPGFPLTLQLGGSSVPAIADIDLDGHNEILIGSDYWPGYPGDFDKVWAYDLGGSPHGRIEWGQMGGGYQHRSYYPPGVVPIAGLRALNDGPTPWGSMTLLSAAALDGCGISYRWDLGDGSLGGGDSLIHTYAVPGVYTAVVTATNSIGLLTATTVVTVTDVPVTGLVAINDSPTVLGSPTVLTATVAGGTHVTFTWDLGDGTTGIGATITHTYTTVGPHTATVTASNFGSALVTNTWVLVDETIAGLRAASSSPTILGQVTALTATVGAGSNILYRWGLGDGTAGSGEVLTHTYAALGVYTAIVTASNSVSTLRVTTTVVITDAPIVGLAAVNDSPTELGRPTALTATVAGGTSIVYTWDLGDGTVASGATVTHLYPALGAYTAVVTAGNSLGRLTATTSVVVVEAPIGGLAAVSDSPTVLGRATTLTATVAAGTHISYRWDLGDGTMGSGAVVTHTYANPRTYTAVVTAANSVSTETTTTQVFVDQAITGLIAANDGPTPWGSPTTLTAFVTHGSNIAYRWTFGDGSGGSGRQPTHTYAEIGFYRVEVTASNSVGFLTATTNVTVQEAVSGLTADNDSPTILGNRTTLTATVATGSNVVYAWDFGDGTTRSGRLVTHQYGAVGHYTATVRAYNAVNEEVVSTTVVVLDVPITGLVVTNSGPTLLGDPTILTATVVTGTNVTFTWALGDGESGAGAVVSHIYPAVGVYTATVTASNSSGQQVGLASVVVRARPLFLIYLPLVSK